jgi:LPS sulfotransferase NodH
MTTEQQPTIKLELTDKQLEVLGTAIGAEIVRKFDAQQEWKYSSPLWTSKLVEKFADTIVQGVSSHLEYKSQDYTRIVNVICDSFIKHVTYHEKALSQLGYKIWGAKK